MDFLFRFYRLINILSLDIAAGAMISALLFAHIFDAHILPAGLAALGITVWIIYTSDHLMDAWKIKEDAITERHRFHHQHFKGMLWLLATAFLLDVLVLTQVRHRVFLYGMGLGFLVLFYLLAQRYLKFFKEVAGAFLYSAGVMLPAIANSDGNPDYGQFMLVVQFFLVALVNLLVFSWFDFTSDNVQKQYSFTTRFGKEFTRSFIRVLFGLHVLLMVVTPEAMVVPSLLLAVMHTGLQLILWRRKFFSRNGFYRMAGDAVFYLPLVFLLHEK